MSGCDMIVNLYKLPELRVPEGCKIKRVFAADKERVLSYIRENFSAGWAWEAERAMLQEMGKCFIATKDGKILGFACYDGTAKGYFGPIGVSSTARGKGIGQALLIRTLNAMREYGYGYGIIGWVGEAELFYRKTVGAEFIKGGEPENTVYSNLICM